MWTGFGLMVISCLFFSFVALFVRLSSETFPTQQLAFARSSVNFLICLLVAYFQGISLIQKTSNRGLILRSLAGICSMILYFKSLQMIKLADAVLLNSTVPLFAALYQSVKSRTLPPKATLVLLFIGLFGIILILNPEFGFFNSAGLWGIMSAACAGVAMLALHGISRRFSPVVIISYFTGISTLLLLPTLPTFILPASTQEWTFLIAIGVAASISQGAMTRGYARLDAVTASQLSYITVIFSTVLGAAVLKEVPTWNFYVGSLLVILSCGLLAHVSSKRVENRDQIND